jgi:hypothetical protein
MNIQNELLKNEYSFYKCICYQMSLRSLNQGGEDWDVSVVMNAYKIFSLAM